MDDEAELESDLLDVSGIDLEQLDALPNSVFGASLRRILAESSSMPDQYAAFQSAIRAPVPVQSREPCDEI